MDSGNPTPQPTVQNTPVPPSPTATPGSPSTWTDPGGAVHVNGSADMSGGFPGGTVLPGPDGNLHALAFNGSEPSLIPLNGSSAPPSAPGVKKTATAPKTKAPSTEKNVATDISQPIDQNVLTTSSDPIPVTINRTDSSSALPLPSNQFGSFGYTFILMDGDGKVEKEITLAVAPEEFQQVETSTSNVILTAGDVFTDSFGPGLTLITLAGTFGQRPTGNNVFGNFGSTRIGNLSTALNSSTSSGQWLVLQLRDMFRQYLDKQNPILYDAKTNYGRRLQFLNPKDNEFWNIEPVKNWFTLSRSKSSPFLYRYKLTFVCTTKVDQRGTGFLADVQNARMDANAFITGNYTRFSDTLNSISNYASEISTVMGYVGSAYVDFSANIFTPLTDIQSAINNFLTNTTGIINYPLSNMVAVKNNIADLQQNLTTLLTTNPSVIYDPYLDNLLVKTSIIMDNFQLYPNLFAKQFLTSDFVSQTLPVNTTITYIDIQDITDVKYYVILAGDTIEGIAFKTLGDVTYWKMLAEFNGLAYPYISVLSPKPDKTLGPGDTMAIPITFPTAQQVNNLVLGSSIDSRDPNSGYGVDFYLDPTQDITFQLTTANNALQKLFKDDLVTVTGVPNLMQALGIKLNVHKGELTAHPQFGLTDFTGYRTTNLLSAKAYTEFRSTMLSDSRVVDVINQNVNITADIMNYSAELKVRTKNQLIALEGALVLSK